MSAFLYYIPSASGRLTDPMIAAAGLEIFVGPARLNPYWRIDGPDGGSGILLSGIFGRTPDDRIRFRPAAQRWIPEAIRDHQPLPLGEPPRYWLGYPTDAPPGPEDLLIFTGPDPGPLYAGIPLRLADGRAWRVPSHLSFTGSRAFSQDPNTLRRGLSALTDLELHLLAAHAAALNYAMTENEVLALGLIDSVTALAVLDAYYFTDPTPGSEAGYSNPRIPEETRKPHPTTPAWASHFN